MASLRLACLPLLCLLPSCVLFVEEDEPPSDPSTLIVTGRCPGSPALVQAVSVAGDHLVVTLGHGGCQRASAWACWNGTMALSEPPQAYVEIRHADAGSCDAYFEQTISVDLAPMISGHSGPVLVNVGDGFSARWEP